MTEKKLSELLNKELDLVVDKKVPSRVLDTPINKVEKNTKKKIVFKKKMIAAISSIACVLIVVLCLSLFLPNVLNKNNVENNYTCYVVDVNPSVLVTLDKEGNVVSISAINEDANLLLMDEDVKNAKSLDECLKNIVQSCAKLGYIDVNSTENAVKVSVKAENDALSKNLAKSASEIIENTLKNEGIFGIVLSNELTMEQLKEKTKLDFNSDNVLEDLKNIKSFTYEKENLDKKFEEYTENLLRQTLLDIKQTVKFIAENEDMTLVEEKIKYLKDTYDLEITKSEAELYNFGLNMIDVENIHSIEDIKNGLVQQFLNSVFSGFKDQQEYLQEIIDSFNEEYQSRLNEYKVEFEKTRQSISKENYQEYLNGIIEKYGSLENYYENILKK